MRRGKWLYYFDEFQVESSKLRGDCQVHRRRGAVCLFVGLATQVWLLRIAEDIIIHHHAHFSPCQRCARLRAQDSRGKVVIHAHRYHRLHPSLNHLPHPSSTDHFFCISPPPLFFWPSPITLHLAKPPATGTRPYHCTTTLWFVHQPREIRSQRVTFVCKCFILTPIGRLLFHPFYSFSSFSSCSMFMCIYVYNFVCPIISLHAHTRGSKPWGNPISVWV